ncbi:hypothetical protein ACEPAG_5340 [Sanghuangporus baumii]
MDSDDELGTYDTASTPFRVSKYEDVNSRNTKPNGLPAVAGPSSKPPSKSRSNARKRNPSPPADDEDAEEARASDDDAIVLVGESAASVPRKGRSKRAASRDPEPSRASKAKSIPRGKGKAKAKANDARDPSPEVMDIDNLDEIRADVDDEPQEVPQAIQAWSLKRHQTDTSSASWKKREERHKRELERLQKHCQDAFSQRDNLARQLEELFQTRHTEAEANAEQQAAVYESRIQAQEEMIQELTSQLARVDSLTREGKISTLHFLTREAADEERRGVERQVEKLKQALRDKDKVIAEKDATINNQAEEILQIQKELTAEIERSKSLASSRTNGREALSKSRTPSGPKSGVRLEGLKATQAHKMYEDLTNILILDCHCEIAVDTNEEQWVYSCLYAPSDSRLNIAFTLRTYNEAGETGEEVEKVAYTPKEMSNQSPEWLERLDFLADEFTFQRKQLDVFLDKLYTAMNEAQEHVDVEE